MGRASNRKKIQRQSGQKHQVDAVTERALRGLVMGLKAMMDENEARNKGIAAALRVWGGGVEPVPAQAPQWPEGSLGDLFFTGTNMLRAQAAPCLATAEIPSAEVIADDSSHWDVATRALIRAVTFDDLGLDHPAVGKVLEILAPIVETELAYNKVADAAMNGDGLNWDEDLAGFPELDGPVFLLGVCALVEAFAAVVAEDLLGDVRGVLLPALEAAVPDLDAQLAADALIGAFAVEFDCGQPENAEVMAGIKSHGGNALENLVTNGGVPPAGVLPAGLAILSVLAELCRTDSDSVLKRTARP